MNSPLATGLILGALLLIANGLHASKPSQGPYLRHLSLNDSHLIELKENRFVIIQAISGAGASMIHMLEDTIFVEDSSGAINSYDPRYIGLMDNTLLRLARSRLLLVDSFPNSLSASDRYFSARYGLQNRTVELTAAQNCAPITTQLEGDKVIVYNEQSFSRLNSVSNGIFSLTILVANIKVDIHYSSGVYVPVMTAVFQTPSDMIEHHENLAMARAQELQRGLADLSQARAHNQAWLARSSSLIRLVNATRLSLSTLAAHLGVT